MAIQKSGMEIQYFNYLESISIYGNNQKYSNKISQSIKKEDFSIANNNNQLSQIEDIKSILDSEFYLIRKISGSPSGKIYLGIHKDSLNNQNNDITCYSIKIMNIEKIDLNTFKNEIKLLKKINHNNVSKIFEYGYGPKISINKNKNKQPKEYYYIVMDN